jgi:hypothetical protein
MTRDSENWDQKIKIKRSLFPLAPLARTPIKFEPFRLLAGLAQERRVSIHDGKLGTELLREAEHSIRAALSDDAFLYGHLTESLFEAMVVALGSVRVIKQEDAGTAYADDPDIKIPDFRLVLSDGSRLLAEVKNFYQQEGVEEFVLNEAYLKGLQKYADLDASILVLGIFWVRWNLWTLVPASRIPNKAGVRKISLGEALKMNCSATIGDVTIGTCPPLRIVLRTDPTSPAVVSLDQVSHEYKITIRGVEIYAGDSLITDETDRKIFDFLRNFGTWEEEDSMPLMRGELLEGIEFRWKPREEKDLEDSERFRMIGSLTSMFSTWFRRKALGADGRPSQTRIEVEPGFLGNLIPEGYHGTQLPLWIFVQSPNFDEGQRLL